MLGTYWDGAGAFSSDLLPDSLVCTTRMGHLGQGRERNLPAGGVGRDKLTLAAIPFCQYLCRRCTAQDTWVDEACEANMGDVAGRAKDALEVPDGFRSVAYVKPNYTDNERQ